MDIGLFAFLSPHFGGLEATYDGHLRLNGKRIVDFLLVLTELFSLGVMAEALRANIGSKLARKIQNEYKFRNRFNHRIAVDWMQRHGANVSGVVFRYFV